MITRFLPDLLTFIKLGAQMVCYGLAFLTGLLTSSMITWRGKGRNVIRTSCLLFASGVCLWTAMMDLFRYADVTFVGLGIKFPLAFLLSCTGYAVAMLADCLLARLVWSLGREVTEINLLDKIMLWFFSKVQPVIYCDPTSPVVTSKSETKDFDNIGAQSRDLILYRLTVFGDGFFVAATFRLLICIQCGINIWSANTTTMVAMAFVGAVVQNIVYAATLVFTILRTFELSPYIQCSLFALGISGTFYSYTFYLLLSLEKELVGDSVASEGALYMSIFSGFFSGSLVYIAVHHLLSERSPPKNPLGKIMLLFFGIGMVGVLSMLSGTGMAGELKFIKRNPNLGILLPRGKDCI